MTAPLKWLKANKHELGMLTGQDRLALEAIAACWELLSQDRAACRAALESAVALLPAMQEKCWPLAKELIARSMDWGDRERVWKEVEAIVGDRATVEPDNSAHFASMLQTFWEMRMEPTGDGKWKTRSSEAPR